MDLTGESDIKIEYKQVLLKVSWLGGFIVQVILIIDCYISLFMLL